MGFHIVEDRPTPREVYNWRIYAMGVAIAMGALTFGYDGAFIGTTITRPAFLTNFGISKMTAAQKTAESANLTSTFTAASFFGALFAWPIMEAWGRKPTLQVAAFIFNVGVVIMTAATTQLSMIYIGRAFTGLAVGAITAVVPSFLAEVSPPPIRGVMTGLFEVAYQVGSVIGFWINYGVTETIDLQSVKAYRIPMAVQLIPGGMLAIGTLFMKESPMLLVKRGKMDAALKNLTYLRKLPADHHYILEEVAMINNRIAEENAVAGGEGRGVRGYFVGCIRELKIASIRHRVALVAGMMFLQNFSGALCINYYSPTIFKAIGISNTTLFTGIYGLVKAIAAIIFFLVFVDRYGRRNPWMLSAGICALWLLYLGVYIKVGHPATSTDLSESTKKGGTAAVAVIMIYAIFWAFGGNGLPWVVSAEIFPVRLRSMAGAWAGCMQWLSSYVITKSFPSMIASMGWGVFIFFAGICTLTVVFTFIWIPETKGVPIEAMDQLFGGPSRHRQWTQKKIYPPFGMPSIDLQDHTNAQDVPSRKMDTEYVEHEHTSSAV